MLVKSALAIITIIEFIAAFGILAVGLPVFMRFWEHVRSKYWLRTSAETLASVEDQALAYHIKSTFKVYQVPVSSEAVEESRLSKCFKSCFSLNQKKVTYSINVLEAGMMEDVQQQKTIVFMHGFGLGLPFWFPNIDTFVEQGYRVIAVRFCMKFC